ncbi:unnamed protein product [Sphenostylis stenocarpa]|uniref:Peptidase S9 prolyl oligopeptidase catalytic domain-containing protein n=1 Tax=Sphenostylis stenocarpa TaxID=92480 RepID=A0AA86SVZ8_9FABA|nr:unnamed protein product [Sphenostylis stenocarpa]
MAKPVTNPLYQSSPPTMEEIEILESTPKADLENLDELLQEENFYLNIEAYASRGYIAISVDSRYHGDRATNTTTYRDALISAWKTGETMPFIYDTVWDLIKLADYLTRRKDIYPSRIGITGISLGGRLTVVERRMHAWFAAFADTRYAVVVPVIGVQGFRWAIDNDEWEGRVEAIKPLFEGKMIMYFEYMHPNPLRFMDAVARDDMDKDAIDKEVVEKVWDRIAPGLASQFDSPYSLPAIAPRPLLILNVAEDSQCPLGGLEIPRAKASQAYRKFNCLDHFKVCCIV